MARVFKFKGKTIEELKKMPIEEFMKLVPSRVRRSIKRGFTEQEKKLLKKIRAANEGKYKKNIKTHCREMPILPEMVDLLIHIHDGRAFIPIKITGEMLGHVLGEFTYNRKGVKHSAPGIGATRSSAALSVK